MSFADKLKQRLQDVKNNSIAPPDMAATRLAICKACPEFIPITSTCKKCGCFMTAKTHILKAVCPLSKW